MSSTSRVREDRMQRADGIDAAFLAAETPQWHFHVSALQILDPTDAPDFGFSAFYRLCEQRLHLVAQFRWKLIEPPFRLGWSWFADDPDFDLANHLHHVVLPAPGATHELDAMIGDLLGRKIDRTRPLWEMWFIEGLAGGRVAVLTKVHHSIIDGQSGAEVATLLFDLTPEPPVETEPERYEPATTPSWLEIVGRNTLQVASMPVSAARFGRQIVEQGVASVPYLFGKKAPAMPFQAPSTPFNGQLTPHRSFAAAALPLDAVHALKTEVGVKLNDIVLAVCAGVLRSYLHDNHQLPDRALIAQVPISLRTADNAAHNRKGAVGTKVGSMFVSLATDIADPVERLHAIHDSSVAAKHMQGTLAEHGTLGFSDVLLPSVFSAAARAWSVGHLDGRTPPIFNLIISNVAGPPMDFYVAGARVEHMYPLGPLLYGGGLNITVFSNGGTIDIGLISCPELVADPRTIAERFVPVFDELVAAVKKRRRRKVEP